MGYLCDFCGGQRSMVYCRSDTAFLCLSCDRNVHSANALSKRHSRTLVCERCNAEPASVRCIDEGISLCQNCHFVGHDRSVASLLHKTQRINSYSGCPSSAELSTIWSFISEIPFSSSKDSSCQEGLGSLSIADITTKNSADPAIKDIQCNAGVMLGGHDLQRVDTNCDWIGSSSVPELLSCEVRGRRGCTNSSKMYYNTGISRICDDDPYADLDMDEVDIDLENYDELFGYSLTHSEHLLENGGISSLFIRQAKFTADSNCHGRPGVEGLSAGITNQMQATCSNAVSGDSAMSIKTEPNLGLATKQTHSGVSFSGITGDNSVDYQDCGASSMLLLGEPPWCPPCPENSLQSSTRTEAVMRYKEKKKSRKFDKRVRYASRKERADVRKRVKGRFIKAGELYDYDPTRSI